MVRDDVKLRVRHGSGLIIRNNIWHVSDGVLNNVILGRPLLDTVVCDNHSMLSV